MIVAKRNTSLFGVDKGVVLLCWIGLAVLHRVVTEEQPNENSFKPHTDMYRKSVASGWDDDGVFVLTPENFDSIMAEKKALLVNFHGSMMQHSKEFHPAYAGVAKALNVSHPGIFSAKVDCLSNRVLQKRFNIANLPTVVLFPRSKPDHFFDYHGSHTTEGVVNWVIAKMQGSATILNSVKEVLQLIEKSKVLVIGFFKDLESQAAITYKDTIEFVDNVAYGISSNPDVLKEYAPDRDNIILFKKFDEKRVEFSSDKEMTENNIGIFIMTHMLPDINKFTWDSMKRYTHSDIKFQLMLYLAKSSPDYKQHMRTFRAVAKAYKGTVLCYWVDVDNQALHNMFPVVDIKLSNMPLIRALSFYNEGSSMYKYQPTDIVNPLSLEGMKAFVESILQGKRDPYYKSEPSEPRHMSKPLKYIVGSDFTRIAFDKTKSVLIYFWAQWCSTCNTTAHTTFAKVAEDLQDRGDIVIGHTDYQQNEYPGMIGDGFPCTWLFLKETNEQIEFKGRENYHKLMDFVLSDGQKNEKEEEKTEEKSDEKDEVKEEL